MKILAPVAAATLLAGCTNMVMSERPLFTQADAKGAPKFRPGVWASPEPGCDVDLKSHLEGWPKCAHGDVVGPDGPVMPDAQVKVVMVAGDPAIIQLAIPEELRKAGQGLPGGGAGVFYAALKPVQSDDRGQVIAFEGWVVECGPPPPPRKAEDGSEVRLVTERPLAGLRVVEDHCLAAQPATVREAAAASRAWQTQTHLTRWIRDGRN